MNDSVKKRGKKRECPTCGKIYYRQDHYENHLKTCVPSHSVEEPKVEKKMKDFIPEPVEIIFSEQPPEELKSLLGDQLVESEDEESTPESNEESVEVYEDIIPEGRYGRVYRIKDVLFPSLHDDTSDISPIPKKLESWFPSHFEGLTSTVESHQDMYDDLMKQTKLSLSESIPFGNFELTPKTALLGLAARDITVTYLRNRSKRKLIQATQVDQEAVDSLVKGLIGDTSGVENDDGIPKREIID